MLRVSRLAALLIVIATMGGLGALAIAPAQAASVQQAHVVSTAVTSSSSGYACYFPASGFYCLAHTLNGNAPLFWPSGSLYTTLPLNDEVKITCYYSGNPPAPWHGDGYMDHVTWENISNPITGHIPDYYINLGGNYPWQIGIPHC